MVTELDELKTNDKNIASRIKAFFENAEADKIGGVVFILLAEQGAGKTIALWLKGKTDFDDNRVVMWRGQKSCQWMGLAAQEVPVTIWLHDIIEQPKWFMSVELGEEPEHLDIEDLNEWDVQVKRFSSSDELVQRIGRGEGGGTDRAHVYYIPGFDSGVPHEKYFALQQQAVMAQELTQRPWKGTHVTLLWDEVGEIHPMEQRKPYNEITEHQLPSAEKDFRKANINVAGSAHNTNQIHWRLWQNHTTSLVYMRGASVKSEHKQVDQGIISGLDRGHFVVPAGGAIEKDHFVEPTWPVDVFPWVEFQGHELNLQYKADIPDLTE